MSAKAITLEALQEAYGDALLVTGALDGGTWRLLVDTGTGDLRRARSAICKPLERKNPTPLRCVLISYLDGYLETHRSYQPS